MKKFAKMSLVAAIAVAGTVASAQPLAEAIKNVDVSGTVVYRYNDINYDDVRESSTDNNYKVAATLKSKVTDDVTFNSRFIVGGANGGFAGLDTQNAGDSNVDVELSWANFSYTGIANTTVIVGKQGVATPWTKAVDSDGSEQTGTGIVAMTTMGPVTAAAGYFNQTNFLANEDVIVAALMGSFGPVNVKAWYLDADNTFDAYFLKVSGKMGPVSAYAQYSDRDTDNAAGNDDINLLKVGVSAKMGIFNAAVTYAKTGEDGSGIVNAVSENSAIGWSTTLSNKVDSDGIWVDLGAQVMPKLHVGLNYDKTEQDNVSNVEHEEYHVQLTYKHAKNLSAYVRVGQGENNTVDYNRGRLQVEYKF